MSDGAVFELPFDGPLNVVRANALERVAGIRCKGLADGARQVGGSGVLASGGSHVLITLTRRGAAGWVLTGIPRDASNVDRSHLDRYVRGVRRLVEGWGGSPEV